MLNILLIRSYRVPWNVLCGMGFPANLEASYYLGMENSAGPRDDIAVVGLSKTQEIFIHSRVVRVLRINVSEEIIAYQLAGNSHEGQNWTSVEMGNGKEAFRTCPPVPSRIRIAELRGGRHPTLPRS